ncbi:MAG: molybdopterin converting factor subunit 1 [Candidatus Bathyarchaeota archaeon]|nr:MAG: molybdopterin converting factor subunit 1 [Candidatus Bathyarchaeota archaeon]
MIVCLRFFASFREIAGMANGEIEIAEGSTVGALLEALEEKHEVFRDRERVLIAVNGEYVDMKIKLNEGDVVAFFPPVSGG